MHVNNVLPRQEARVIRQRLIAELDNQGDVVKGVCHGGRISHGYIPPRQLLGAVVRDQRSQTNAVRQVAQVLDARELRQLLTLL